MANQIPTWSDRDVSLRQWQEAAFAKYLSGIYQDFLLVATPGAGKSLWSLRVAHHLLSSGVVDRIVVVVPTSSLRDQWTKSAHRVGIEIEPDFQCGSGTYEHENKDFHGIAVTYQKVCNFPELFDFQCRWRPTAVILDEIHHAGIPEDSGLMYGEGWGPKLKLAFENAVRRISISGTPFRSDNNKIPFISYENNRSRADYSYGYSRALSDKVCRPVYFPSYEGKMEWVSRNNEIVTASFADTLDRQKSSDRLRVALDPFAAFVPELLGGAHECLMRVREEGNEDAGGLVIARDQNHARDVKKVLEGIAGHPVEIALSDDPNASEVISRFSRSRAPWLIAVKMVSEGVDIPRLQVGVYLTNIQTELTFRQVVGRTVRQRDPEASEIAYFFFPKDPSFVGFIRAFMEEREHDITVSIQELYGWDATSDRLERAKAIGFLPITIAAEGNADDVFDQGGDAVSQDEIVFAREIQESAGVKSLDTVALAKCLRIAMSGKQSVVEMRTQGAKTTLEDTSQPLYQRKKEKKALKKKLVSQIAESWGGGSENYKRIHMTLMRLVGKPGDKVSMEDLDTQIKYLLECRGGQW